MATCFIIAVVINLRVIQRMHNEYSLLERNDTVSGQIEAIKKLKGTCFIKVDSQKIMIFPSENRLYKKSHIRENLFVGDSILKNFSSDTIYIIRDSNQLFFVHEEIIGK